MTWSYFQSVLNIVPCLKLTYTNQSPQIDNFSAANNFVIYELIAHECCDSSIQYSPLQPNHERNGSKHQCSSFYYENLDSLSWRLILCFSQCISVSLSYLCWSYANILISQIAWQANEVAAIYAASNMDKVVLAGLFQ